MLFRSNHLPKPMWPWRTVHGAGVQRPLSWSSLVARVMRGVRRQWAGRFCCWYIAFVDGALLRPTAGFFIALIPAAPAAARLTFTAGSEAFGVSVEPSDKFVYVVASGRNAVYAYGINPQTGALTSVSGSPFTAGRYPEEIATCRVAGTVCKPPA